MIKNKNLFKNISILFILIPMLLLSIFIISPKREKINVYADVVLNDYTFVGSNIILPVTDVYSGDFNRYIFCIFSFSFGASQGQFNYTIESLRHPSSITSPTPNITANTTYNGVFNGTGIQYASIIVNTSGNKIDFSVRKTGQISNTVNRVRIYTEFVSGSYYNVVEYYDDLSNSIAFRFEVWDQKFVEDGYMLDDRTYYIDLDYLGDNSYYEAGYTDGYNDGYNIGTNDGYNEGYNVGNNIGYGNGYNAGLEEGGDYTFLSLMGAVVDAPVSAFTSLLNFELLGFNMLAFFTGLLTLALIIFIVKLILGGK